MIKTFRSFDSMENLHYHFNKAKEEFGNLIPSKSYSYVENLPGFEILQSGYLDTNLLITSIRDLLHKQNAIVFNSPNAQELLRKLGGDARNQVIFCEGWKSSVNPLWNWLPFKLSKGEILTFYSPSLDLNGNIFSSNHLWIVPLKNGMYKMGSTFEWKEINEEITETSKKLLIERFYSLFPHIKDVEVVSQDAGIRPTVIDTKPLLGVHPEHPNYFIFNGLGTKGVLMAPLLSEIMLKYLEDGFPLPQDVNITRFNRKS